MKSLLIKLSGELLSLPQENRSSSNVDFTKNLPIRSITQQIKTLSKKYFIGIVIGGGNFFRGNQHGKALGITGSARHHVGMLATMMNGVLLKDLLSQEEVNSETLSAIECPKIALQITEKNIKQAKEDKKVIIFVAGTGKPFFTTDTAAIMRAHQIGSTMVFKATKVDSVYTSDPIKNPDAQKIKTLTYKEALDKEIKVVDKTALTLAQEHGIVIKIFNAFDTNAVVNAVENKGYGSTITP